jgi:ornithine carbamoyltransferase
LRFTCRWVRLRSVIRSQRERPVNRARLGGASRPWKRFQLSVLILTAFSIGFLKGQFLTGEELDRAALAAVLERAAALKAGRDGREGADSLAGKSVGLVFEKPSTRTRISFEVGVAELGGTPLILRGDELQLSRGESVGDTGRVLSRYLHGIVIRAGSHEVVEELASSAEVPVINGLTPRHHPCQALADLLTLRERFGDLAGLRLAYVGDGNNVARSLAILCRTAGVELAVAAPSGYQLEDGLGAELTDDPKAAAAGADALYTDVWVSMGDEAEAAMRRSDLGPFQLNRELLSAASDRAIVLHCLPAHPGEEITEDVLYGERSAVWDQAENRLHAQKALLESLIA